MALKPKDYGLFDLAQDCRSALNLKPWKLYPILKDGNWFIVHHHQWIVDTPAVLDLIHVCHPGPTVGPQIHFFRNYVEEDGSNTVECQNRNCRSKAPDRLVKMMQLLAMTDDYTGSIWDSVGGASRSFVCKERKSSPALTHARQRANA